MALNKLKAWRVINEEALVKSDFYDDAALDAACKEWLLETLHEEVTGQKVISKKFKKHLAVEYREWQELNGTLSTSSKRRKKD